ncbi:MAG: VCBS repeat-containing protein [Planctomycetota bacterium]|nr:VCBS repeat-containing protein [Planctomycetota bacterium]
MNHSHTSPGAILFGGVYAALACATLSTRAQAQAPLLKPWVFQNNGELVWKEHRYVETNANTVFAIAMDLVTLPQVEHPPGTFGPQQTGVYPEVLLCNFAQFDPPEGEPSVGPRLLSYSSIQSKGLQLYVNYSNAIVDHTAATGAGGPTRYNPPTFFIELEAGTQNMQTTPPVAPRGFNVHTISATRAAFGVVGVQLSPHTQAPQIHPGGATPTWSSVVAGQVNAVYVTAGIGYAITEMSDTILAAEACRDRLLMRDAAGYWQDETSRIPDSAKLGNSSGVAFADFTGDGHMDLYVGMQGDNYAGAKDRLLVYLPGTGQFSDQTTTRIPNLPSNATNEVAAADLNNDGKIDIVSVGRKLRSGAPIGEMADFALINDGIGNFSVIPLGATVLSDSRSVAIGDLDHDAYPEIVIGNAGADGFSNALAALPGEDHPMQIFRTTNGTTYTDVASTWLTVGLEPTVTKPWTVQVLVADLIGGGTASTSPDGWNDIVIVNHRDILQSDKAVASNVHILRNHGTSTNPPITYGTAYATLWGQTVALENFMQLPSQEVQLFNGTGNRFSGKLATVVSLDPTVSFDESYDLLPGTEHGYGFDFADFDENGVMDAGQTARGYDFLVRDIGVHNFGHPSASGAWHFDITASNPLWQMITNARGKKNPRGQEDIRFEKFASTLPSATEDANSVPDRVHAVVVGQDGASSSTPRRYPESLRGSATVCVLENTGSPIPGFKHEVLQHTLFGTTAKIFVDKKIDPNGRLEARHTSIGDRVDIADMDNDGLLDVLALYQGIADGDKLLTLEAPEFVPTTTIANFMTGWSYLKNMGGPSGSAPNFKDITATNMQDSTGQYSKHWNRGQGACTVGDFDNDGRLDYYTTYARSVNANSGASGSPTWVVESAEQLRDLLFINKHAPSVPGVLKESGANVLPSGFTVLPPLVRELIDDSVTGGFTDTREDSAGSFFVTQGDIDNDGDADVIVTHVGNNNDRTALPSLYVNRLNEPAFARFTEEYESRVNMAGFSIARVHSKTAKDFSGNVLYNGAVADETWAIELGDIDGDGDLDMMCAVGGNVPRILRNKGSDTNLDNIINAADPLPSEVGKFEDITDATIPLAAPSNDGNDIQAVDLDADGDIDLAIDSFFGNVSLWKNNRPIDIYGHITRAYPRVGAKRTAKIELHGAGLTGATAVRFRVGSNPPVDASGTALTLISGNRMKVQIPAGVPLGLSLIQVRIGNRWSRQYFGYFILE